MKKKVNYLLFLGNRSCRSSRDNRTFFVGSVNSMISLGRKLRSINRVVKVNSQVANSAKSRSTRTEAMSINAENTSVAIVRNKFKDRSMMNYVETRSINARIAEIK
jgi:hypothetical protein